MGMIKKISGKSKGIGKLNDGDDPIQTIKIRNDDKIIIFDRGGLIHTVKVSDIIQTELKSPGTQIGRYATIQGGVVMCMPLSEIKEEGEFVFVTERGMIKKTSCSKYGFKTSIISIVLKENDGLASVIYGKGNNDIIVFTKNGFGNRFNTDSFNETSRMSSGVIAIDINKDDQVIGVAKVGKKDTDIALLTDKGNGKMCTLDTFDMGKRRGNALNLITLKSKENLLDLIPCNKKDKFLVIQKKEPVGLEYQDFPVLTRAHHGKKLIAVPNGETIIRFMKV
jgi:DNA gyrase/topoisomerase IV subunit A